MLRRSSPRSKRRRSSARCGTRTCASPRICTTPTTTSTSCSRRSPAAAPCSRETACDKLSREALGGVRLPPARTVAYGDHPDQVGNLHLPAGDGGPWPVVVLVHGGFWRWGWDRTLMTPLARDLASRGFAAWNIEYRRVGQEGGGWPGTLDDVAAAADAVPGLDAVDPTRAVTIGHSAGGQLALWLAGRHRIVRGAPGAAPRLHPVAAVSQAGVADLARGAEEGLGAGACQDLLGGGP